MVEVTTDQYRDVIGKHVVGKYDEYSTFVRGRPLPIDKLMALTEGFVNVYAQALLLYDLLVSEHGEQSFDAFLSALRSSKLGYKLAYRILGAEKVYGCSVS